MCCPTRDWQTPTRMKTPVNVEDSNRVTTAGRKCNALACCLQHFLIEPSEGPTDNYNGSSFEMVGAFEFGAGRFDYWIERQVVAHFEPARPQLHRPSLHIVAQKARQPHQPQIALFAARTQIS